ncbi:MAG: protein kinase [Planctomycetes bacterium]|nr:protein kinase [Planctomycetota bacterium]
MAERFPTPLPDPASDPLIVQALLASLEKRGLMDAANRERLRRRLARAGVADLAGLHGFLAGGGVKPGVAATLLFLLPPIEQPPVGPCRLLAHLADGGMGSVWLADLHGQLVVVKTLREEFSRDREYLRRFQREAVITARLDHPHIVRCLDHGVDAGLAFLVLEFVQGGDVALLLKRQGAIAEDDALAILIQAVRGLAQAWQRSLVHRDVKPANLFIDPFGVVKVADFGLARSTAEESAVLTMQGTTVGSPAFMSPEQIRGGTLDWRTDAYACGCVLFTLLTGDTPFTGSVSEVFTQHLSHAPPDVRARAPRTGQASAELIDRCLAKRPGERFASPAELVARLQQARDALGGDPAASLSQAVVRGSSSSMPCPAGGTGQAAAPRAAPDDDDLIIPFDPAPEAEGTTATQAMPGLRGAPPSPVERVETDPPTLREVNERSRFEGDWSAAPDCPRLALRGPHDCLLVLLAQPEAVLGKQATAPVDLPLRDYPAEACAASCARVSRQHLRLGLRDGRVEVADLGSSNGTLVDGRMLEAQEAVTLDPDREHAVQIPDSVILRVRVLPKRTRSLAVISGLPPRQAGPEPGLAGPAPIDAVRITRPLNRPGLAYALVLRRILVGGPAADLAMPGWEGPPLELGIWNGRWIGRLGAGVWQPVGAALGGRAQAEALRSGDSDL